MPFYLVSGSDFGEFLDCAHSTIFMLVCSDIFVRQTGQLQILRNYVRGPYKSSNTARRLWWDRIVAGMGEDKGIHIKVLVGKPK